MLSRVVKSRVVKKNNLLGTRLETLCSRFKKVEDLYEYCIGGGLYESARGLLSSEIDQASYDPKEYMESMGWDTSDITPELEECIELELTFSKDDVYEVMIALGNETMEMLKEGKYGNIFEAVHYASFEDEVSDTLTNIVAKRLLETIDYCKRKGRW